MRRIFFISIVLILTQLDCSPLWGETSDPSGIAHHERLYVHTDRDFYVAGEHINFHVYLMDGQQPGPRSGFVYLALRRADEIVERVTIPMEQGRASGTLYLSDTLSTGHYGITAFTNWMRNQDESSFFNKPLLIANRFDGDPFFDVSPRDPSQKPDLSFYLEGGTLVEGVENHVMIKAGLSSALEHRAVWIRDMAMDTVAHATLDASGMAGFQLQPDPGNTYHAIIQGEREELALPEASSTGCALHVNMSQQLLSVVLLQSSENPVAEWFRITHRDEVVFETGLDPGGQSIHISTKDEGIPEGLLTLEAIDRNREVVSRRHWLNARRDPVGLSLEADRDTFGPREHINIYVDGSGMTDDHASLSLAVVPEASLTQGSIRPDGYLRALSLAEKFPLAPEEVYNRIAGMDLQELNRYLIAWSAHDVQKQDVQENEQAMDYYMETDKLILSGRVVESATGQAVPDARVVVNTPDTLITLLYTETGEDGSFHMVLPDFYHNKALYLFADPSTVDVPVDVETNGKFVLREPFVHAVAPLSSEKRRHMQKSQDVVRINKAYGIDHMVEANAIPEEELAAPPLLYAQANQTIHMDDFFPLDSLTEIVREIVHSWSLRFRGGEYVSRLTSATTGRTMSGTPVYFLDGIMTDDIGKMAHLDSEGIDRIEVHNYRWVHGEMTFPGIIGIYTRHQTYSELLGDRTSTSVFRESIRDKLRHEAPDYDARNSSAPKAPDVRQLLYWRPDVEIRQGERQEWTFHSGDLGGSYLVIVQGLSATGQPVYKTKTIHVKR